jgi:hypothetical protein
MPASNTYDTTNPGSAVSNREDLADFVTTLAPEKTPVLSLCSRDKAENTVFSWTVDKLEDPAGTTGVIEGADQESFGDAFAGRARLSNYIVELRRAKMVTDRQNAVNSVGPANYAQAELKAVKEIRRDIEQNLCGTQDRAAEDGGGTASMSRGLGDWIDSAGPSDVPAAYRTPAGSIHASGSFTETVLKDIITSIYRQDGQEASLNLVADTALRRVISGFAESTGSTNTTSRQVVQDADGRLRATVSYYESDQGVVRVMNMNPACAPDTTNKDTGYFIPDGALVLKELEPLHSMELPNLGGGPRVLVKWVGGLAPKHPGQLGKITTLS